MNNTTPPFYVLLFLTVAINMGAGVIIPLMPLLLRTYGFSNQSLSIAFFAIIGARFLAQNVGGSYVSRLGAFRVLLVAFVLYIGIMVLYPVVNTRSLFVAFRFLEGIFEGLAVVCLNDLAIELTTQENRGRRMGLFGAAFGVGFTVGPALGGLIYQGFGLKWVFFGTASIALLGLLALLAYWRTFASIATKRGTIQVKKIRQPLFEAFKRQYWSLLLFYQPYTVRRVLFFSLQMILPLFLHDRFAVTPERIGLYFSLSAIFSTVLMPFGGRLAERINPPLLLTITLSIMSACIFLFGLVDSLTAFVAVYVLETIAFCVMLPTAMKYFGDLVADNPERGQILGSFSSLVELSTMVVPFVVLPLYGIGAGLAWGFLAGVCLMAVLPFSYLCWNGSGVSTRNHRQ